jgi:protein-S-isoprenylcysteine O-methyltransferase Ste14
LRAIIRLSVLFSLIHIRSMFEAISVMGYLGMVAGILGLIITRSISALSLFVLAPQLAAVALMLWARITFGRRSYHFTANPTAGGLVTTGPYRFIRHPIYASVCLFTTVGAAANFSVASLLFAGLVWGGALVRMLCEERLVVARYPEYRQYAARTSRIIPYVF